MMKPTVGRVVHFFDHTIDRRKNEAIGPGPYAAIIVGVTPNVGLEDAADPDTPHSVATADENASVRLWVFFPNAATSGTDPEQVNVRQRANYKEYAEGRYWIEPPRV